MVDNTNISKMPISLFRWTFASSVVFTVAYLAHLHPHISPAIKASVALIVIAKSILIATV